MSTAFQHAPACAKTILLYNPQDGNLNDVRLESVTFTHHRLNKKNIAEKKILSNLVINRYVHNSWWSFQIAVPVTYEKQVAIIHKWKQTHHSCSNAAMQNPQVSTCPVLVCAPVSPTPGYSAQILLHGCLEVLSITFKFCILVVKQFLIQKMHGFAS